ncbi:MAG: carboxynorspermidine decarboxylase [Candidatus Peribacteraceae bacterium]|nr:carboxynorspermidine decarboxylase [Candidatus Peribacteraceae bacterium]
MSTNDVFEPSWERDREGFFASLDYSKVTTPAYVIHEGALEENLKILARVKEEAGCTVLLALKGYATWKTFPLVKKYLDGVCASSVNEARLGREEFGKQVHSYAPVFSDRDIEEQLLYADHIVFNSPAQWIKYRDYVKKKNSGIHCGIRINPESAGAGNDLYNPCAKGSRMGSTLAECEKHPGVLEDSDGLHFHALCEQSADDLEEALQQVEKKFGKYLQGKKWINFGGGHHITRKDYDVEKLIRLVTEFKKKHGVQVILEPGEAIGLNAGVLVSSVLDLLENDGKIAMLDTTAEAHMPDVLGMPYRPSVIGAGKPREKKHSYRFGGITCLSGDFIGEHSFDHELKAGDKVVFQNMAIYTTVKNTTFNGVRLPDIIVMDKENNIVHTKKFAYEDFKNRLS